MDNLSEDVRADFLNGSNGAVVSFFIVTWLKQYLLRVC